MNYELAKELKDAGFPLKRTREVFAFEPETETTTGEMTALEGNHPRAFLEPTLSELMEAVDSPYFKLELPFPPLPRPHGKWIAKVRREWPAKEWTETAAKGETPEEAVARLWLSLNKPTT